MAFTILLTLIISFICCMNVVKCGLVGHTLELDRVHLVDVHKFEDGVINYLFRGNSPILNNSFAYDSLIQYMAIRAIEAGFPFPAEFFLTDLVLDGPADEPDWQPEDDYFSAMGYKYKFGYNYQWDLNHNPEQHLNLSNMSSAAIYDMCVYNESYLWYHDKIPTRIDMTRQFLLTEREDKLSTVMYAHCQAGCDRTGQFIYSYRLRYLMTNITEIYCLDCKECGRCPDEKSTLSLEWFCNCYGIQSNQSFGDCNKWVQYAELDYNETDLQCSEPYS